MILIPLPHLSLIAFNKFLLFYPYISDVKSILIANVFIREILRLIKAPLFHSSSHLPGLIPQIPCKRFHPKDTQQDFSRRILAPALLMGIPSRGSMQDWISALLLAIPPGFFTQISFPCSFTGNSSRLFHVEFFPLLFYRQFPSRFPCRIGYILFYWQFLPAFPCRFLSPALLLAISSGFSRRFLSPALLLAIPFQISMQDLIYPFLLAIPSGFSMQISSSLSFDGNSLPDFHAELDISFFTGNFSRLFHADFFLLLFYWQFPSRFPCRI